MEFITITNDVELAKYFEECGIDDIMVDLETIGKAERQKGLNAVLSNHSFDDISKIKNVLTTSKCLVRINPIHEGSKSEVDEAIDRGADILMLPMFKTKEEVEIFIDSVGGRTEAYLLLETPQALTRVDEITSIKGIDAIHIGLNDLSIGMGLSFLFEPLIGGIVEYLAGKIIPRKIKFGFGGVSRLERGKNIISEHIRLGSQMVILNRDFRFYKETIEEIRQVVDAKEEIHKIRTYIKSLQKTSPSELEENRLNLIREIKNQIIRSK
jgi:2-keto-3-deoxy-L-rhamnonate aldolase RhmA